MTSKITTLHVALLLIATRAVAGDECESICSLIPGACSGKGSYCKNGHDCMDVFWHTNGEVLCNSADVVCTGRRELLCSEARSIVDSGNRAGIVSFVNMAAPTTTTTTTTTTPSTTTTGSSQTSTRSTTPEPTSSMTSTTTSSTSTVSTTTTTSRPISGDNRDLVSVFERARTVVSRPNSELESAPQNPQVNGLIASNLGGTNTARFTGVGVPSGSVLPTITAILSRVGTTDRCLYLFEFMVEPVAWFWLTQSSVQTLRECTQILVTNAPASIDQPFMDAVSNIIAIVFSPAAELLVRAPRVVPTSLSWRSFYRAALTNLMSREDGISVRIAQQVRNANDREYMRFLRPQETRFLNRLIDSDFHHPSVSYLVNFIDFKDSPLFLSRMIAERIPDYDSIEINQMVDMRPTGAGEYWAHVARLETVQEDAMRNYQPWLNSVGSFIYLIWDTNRGNDRAVGVFNTCVTPGFFAASPELAEGRLRNRSDLIHLFRYLNSPRSDAKQMYQCFTDALLGGRLAIPEGMEGRITYFLRLTTTVSSVW